MVYGQPKHKIALVKVDWDFNQLDVNSLEWLRGRVENSFWSVFYSNILRKYLKVKKLFFH